MSPCYSLFVFTMKIIKHTRDAAFKTRIMNDEFTSAAQ